MKETTYKKEELFLSPYAQKSAQSKGRFKYPEACDMRTDFQRDRDRIIHSKAFRRLKNKTQVFLSPEGDHYRTRMTHTLDVSQIARSIARCLDLNEDLCEAAALGHDLGHTPFGHSGERILNKLTKGYFKHNEQSLRVVDVLENDGKGLNLSFEVRDAILNHKKDAKPATLEGVVVSFADRIAYINHDIDDAIRAKIIKAKDLPEKEYKLLGKTGSERINNAISSIYRFSGKKNLVDMEPGYKNALESLRDFMFEKVYLREQANEEEQKSDRMLSLMFDYFYKNPDKMPGLYVSLLDSVKKEIAVCDYLSGMSDDYAIFVFERLYVPRRWMLKDN